LGYTMVAKQSICIFLAITEVNVKLAYEYFLGETQLPMLTFRKLLAQALIYNNRLEQATDPSPRRNIRRRSVEHRLETQDQYKRWKGDRWVKAQTQFGQRKCVGCIRKIRTYCACNPGMALCNECYVNHVIELENGHHGDD
jgi:hypothetical protein